jgi:hypothetical protein
VDQPRARKGARAKEEPKWDMLRAYKQKVLGSD